VASGQRPVGTRIWFSSPVLSGREKPQGPEGPPGQGAAAPGSSEHRHGAEAPRLQLAGQLMGQLRRDEAGLFDRATATAIEDRDALISARLAATGIDVHQQLADFAAGERGSHHERGEGHPRQASAVATQQGRLYEAPGPILVGARRLGQLCLALVDREASGPPVLNFRQLGRRPLGVGSRNMPGPVAPPASARRSRPAERQGLGEPRRLASIGHQRLQLWIDRHGRQGCLLLEQHLSGQIGQPGIAIPAERQILQQLPAALLQMELAGERGHGSAPLRTPQPAGGGSRARPPQRCGAQRSQGPQQQARITLDAPPDHGSGRSGAPSGAGGRIAAALLAPSGNRT